MSLNERIRKRGGRWGIRALRLSLAAADSPQRGLISRSDFTTALTTYGISNPSDKEVSALFQEIEISAGATSSLSNGSGQKDATNAGVNVFAIMNALCGTCPREILRAVSLAFQVVRSRFLASQGLLQAATSASFSTVPSHQQSSSSSKLLNPTVQYLCAEVNLTAHPDVETNQVPHRDALFCFYTLWGLARDQSVSQELFLQFHVDFLVNFPMQNAVQLVYKMWDITSEDTKRQEMESTQVQLVPDRATSDSVFDSIDANGNGHLSLAELDLAVMRLWPTMNFKPAIMRAYKLAEKSGDGYLSKSEFAEFLKYLVTYNSLLMKFRQIDTNSDGRLSFDELKQNKHVLGLHFLGDVELRNIFKAMDRNQGGYVLFEEFCMCIAKRQGMAELEKETSQLQTQKGTAPSPAGLNRQQPVAPALLQRPQRSAPSRR